MIGLIPEAACERESDWMRQLVGFDERDQDSGAAADAAAGVARSVSLSGQGLRGDEQIGKMEHHEGKGAEEMRNRTHGGTE